jgi:hypothetical protein
MSFTDMSYDIGVGQKCVTIGKPTDTKRHIFGTQTLNSTLTAPTGGDVADATYEATFNTDAVSRSVGYCAPIVSGALAMKVGNSFKLSGEAHMSSSDLIVISDFNSQVSSVEGQLYAKVDATANAEAILLVNGTQGGLNGLQVEPKVGMSVKAEYEFGSSDQGATLGFGFLRSADEFSYSTDRMATAGMSKITATQAAAGVSAATEVGDTFALDVNNPSRETYDEAGFWLGGVASATSKINDSLSLKVNAGYYMRDFDASSGGNSSVKFIVKTTPSTLSVFSVSLSMSR